MYRALIIIVSTLGTVDVIWSRASSLKLWLDLTPGILRPRFLDHLVILDSIRVTAEMRENWRRNSFILYPFFLFCDLFKWFLCIVFSPLQYNQWFRCWYDHVSLITESSPRHVLLSAAELLAPFRTGVKKIGQTFRTIIVLFFFKWRKNFSLLGKSSTDDLIWD